MPHLPSSRLDWAPSDGGGQNSPQSSKRGQVLIHKLFSSLSCVTFAVVPLAKASHMVKPRVSARVDFLKAWIWEGNDPGDFGK